MQKQPSHYQPISTTPIGNVPPAQLTTQMDKKAIDDPTLQGASPLLKYQPL
jgi:hypothetical protein